jgi:hypothetical protein
VQADTDLLAYTERSLPDRLHQWAPKPKTSRERSSSLRNSRRFRQASNAHF